MGSQTTPESQQKLLARAMRYCATRERAPLEVRQYLERQDASEPEINGMLEYLQQEGYLSEERYARAYARDKARFSGWGPLKIAAALRAKRIPQPTVEQALADLREEGDAPDLRAILSRKLSTLKPSLTPHEAKARLLRFAASRGFTLDETLAHVDHLLRERRAEE